MKLGLASEAAKAIVEGEDEGASKALLADYSITPGSNIPLRTPRTPAQQDTVLQVCWLLIDLAFLSSICFAFIHISR